MSLSSVCSAKRRLYDSHIFISQGPEILSRYRLKCTKCGCVTRGNTHDPIFRVRISVGVGTSYQRMYVLCDDEVIKSVLES